MTVPGIGPVISSAVVAAIATGSGFKQGRDFAAWLGLVPSKNQRAIAPNWVGYADHRTMPNGLG